MSDGLRRPCGSGAVASRQRLCPITGRVSSVRCVGYAANGDGDGATTTNPMAISNTGERRDGWKTTTALCVCMYVRTVAALVYEVYGIPLLYSRPPFRIQRGLSASGAHGARTQKNRCFSYMKSFHTTGPAFVFLV